ncbi:Axonemal beta dynein heavy chain 2 [Intoshia linei]|uniref:Axonemal beta dynein heavy chain 2 n=1 Tax=Intoshia linei TaxID=1819745 RepID=A0A177B4M0_9BILA|nr:Axonemal beta dynein heavy chain 2 [Intoshia linei]
MPSVTNSQNIEYSSIHESENIDFDSEDFVYMVNWIKKKVILSQYRYHMWDESHGNIINEYLVNKEKYVLIIFMDTLNGLTVQYDVPRYEVSQFYYFAKVSSGIENVISSSEILKQLTFGMVNGSGITSLLRLMNNVYAPTFHKNSVWPDSKLKNHHLDRGDSKDIKNAFASQLHKFMATLSDHRWKQVGKTVLYVPVEAEHLDEEKAVLDKELISRIESYGIIHWTRQIKEAISAQDALQTKDNSPLEEIEFWKNRCNDLSGISRQLDKPGVVKICKILDKTKSTYTKSFYKLAHEIKAGSSQAANNLKFLSLLKDPCIELSETDPVNIHKILPKIINTIRVIWVNSEHYKSKERLTGIFRKLSNEIIKKCTESIDLNLFFSGHVSKSKKSLNEAIKCCKNWMNLYSQTEKLHIEFSEVAWNLDRISIFAQMEAYLQRCSDLLEICDCQVHFGRYEDGEQTKIPNFGGKNNESIKNSLMDIQVQFDDLLKTLYLYKHTMLDVKNSEWNNQYNLFHNGIKDIEIIMQNCLKKAFMTVNTVQEGIEIIDLYTHLYERESIRRVIDKNTMLIMKFFNTELNDVKKEIGQSITCTNYEFPFYSGKACWIKMLKNRIQKTNMMIDRAYFLPVTPIANEVKQQYHNLIITLDDYIRKMYVEWNEYIDNNPQKYFDMPLMKRNPKLSVLIDINFDKMLVKIFREIHYWLSLNFDIPHYAANINEKSIYLYNMQKHVLMVTHDYNSIINTLSENERKLFKERIRFLDKKLYPGFSKLTWASKGISEMFISECRSHTSRIQNIVNKFKEANENIKKNCRSMSKNLLLRIEDDYVYEYREFEQSQERHRSLTESKLHSIHNEISDIVCTVYKFFKNDGSDVQNSWINYIDSVDNMIEEACMIQLAPLGGTMFSAFEPNLKFLSGIISSLSAHFKHSISNLKRIRTIFMKSNIYRNSISDVINHDEEIKKILLQINNGINKNATLLETYIATWDNYREIWDIDKKQFIKRYRKLEPHVSSFDADIARYTEISNNIEAQETTLNIHSILLDCSPMKETLLMHCNEWESSLVSLLYELFLKNINELDKYLTENLTNLGKSPSSLEELAESLKLWDKVNGEQNETIEKFIPISEKFSILKKYNVTFTDSEKSLYEDLCIRLVNYPKDILDIEKRLKKEKESFKICLTSQADDFKKTVNAFISEFETNGPFSSQIHINEALAKINRYLKSLQNLKIDEKRISDGLFMFNSDLHISQKISDAERDIEHLKKIWQLNFEWNEFWNEWKREPFSKVDIEILQDSAVEIAEKMKQLFSEVEDKKWEIIETTKNTLNKLDRTIPLIKCLKKPAMRSRHWNKINKNIGQNFDENSITFTVESIVKNSFDQYKTVIEETAASAVKEQIIEMSLGEIETLWKNIDFVVKEYKEKGHFKILSSENIFMQLEDNQFKLSAMKSSLYVKPFEVKVDEWERLLSSVLETIELMLVVQRQWIYLENIFMGEDVRKQMPQESQDFDKIDITWLEITQYINQTKNIIKCVQYKGMQNKMIHMNYKLEEIQKSLDMYLETKRQIFPRFYFLSNEDLLEILGQFKNPLAVMPFFKKLFDNIHKIEMNTIGNFTRYEATSMKSDNNEVIPFIMPTLLDGPVESWLCDVEKNMKSTMKEELKKCKVNLKKNFNKRDKWIKEHPGQLCITAASIQWTADVTKALGIIKDKGNSKNLRSCKKRHIIMLNKFSELLRESISKLLRLKVVALVTVEVHARDIIDKLLRSKCSDPFSFEWLCQLRFYWDREKDNCIIRQTNTEYTYGYEYLGSSSRLVITPLTDRCFITLTTALNLHRGGSPKGPAGTGKTETVKDLGKAMGNYVIIVNCSEGLDYKSMGKIFSGLVQTGAWGCFDEFNRINIEVLSVVAQQILSILSAHAINAEKFIFEGCEISMVSTVGIFITMNPGYSGRTELPDNLKSMFRPIAMVVPDSTLIAEIILFSEGFKNTRLIARKIHTLYTLSRQQLSKQSHYDFELRALVSMLKYSGVKKRLHKDEMSDEEILLLSLKNMTLAKLVDEDKPLFNAIISDLFPGIIMPVISYNDLKKHIYSAIEEKGLQRIEYTVSKVIQLYETKNSRHATMLVGSSMSGKSTCWSILQSALNKMYKTQTPTKCIKTFIVNPKSVSLAELYGFYDLTTSEWTDGILSSIIRNICADTHDDEKWCLLDGPVDTMWVESINSVMDDNKILTLANGERIGLPDTVSLLFETENLDVASPGTVSRSGMVYFEMVNLGWEPYVASWLAKKTSKLMVTELNNLFQKYILKICEFKKMNECVGIVSISNMSAVKSLCNLFDNLLKSEYLMDDESNPQYLSSISMLFQFCLIWSFCCLENDDNRKKIDNFIRELDGSFPNKDTIYEYFFNKKTKTWTHWEEELRSGWKYDESAPFHKLIVPTVDVVRYSFLAQVALSSNIPILFIGPTGTGKTSVAKSVCSIREKENYKILVINLSAQTTSSDVQSMIENCVEKRTKGVYVPPSGKKLLIFMDDFNMPCKDDYGSQPPLELMRLWMDNGFWYDRKKQNIKNIKKTSLMCAMGPPGGGRMKISQRIINNFHVINIPFPQESQIKRIFGSMFSKCLQEFEEELKPIGEIITDATIQLYESVKNTFLPTPAKMHYSFNMRDISRIFQGLLRANKSYHDTKNVLIRLWIHECFRTFSDRLNSVSDKEKFVQLITEKIANLFNLSFHNICPGHIPPIFGDYMSQESVYEDISDETELKNKIGEYMENHNKTEKSTLTLVLLRDVLEHVSRICRIIGQRRGNLILIGIGGSGRQSFSTLASYIYKYSIYKIEITMNYRLNEFREDIKKLYWQTGIDKKPTVFLLTDDDIRNESFLVDISNILSSDELPNIYKADEIEQICTELSESLNIKDSKDSTNLILKTFMENVKDNLHIILCVSPIGESFRNRIRKFPALINCTTIDWINDLSDESLSQVAYEYIETIEDENVQKVKKNLSHLFTYVHKTAKEYSIKMNNEIKRKTYITQKNYLDLAAGYKRLLYEKRDTLGSASTKLCNGLSKIDETREKVEAMSIELEEAKTKVSQFQKQCEEYLVVIVQQKREADEQQKFVSQKSEKIAEEGVKCKHMADLAQHDLDEALPALQEAILALESLNKKDMTEIKSYGRPPALVEKVLEAVMILRCQEPTWAEAKKQIGDANFIKQLMNFDKDNISDKVMKKIGQYCSQTDFHPDIIGRVSTAAKSLCMWVRAMDVYAKIYRVVEPKRQRLNAAQQQLNEKQNQLREAKEKLTEVEQKMKDLKHEYEEKLSQKDELRRKAEHTEIMLDRASKLVTGLASEKTRWIETVKDLKEKMTFLCGDVLIAAGFLSYLGPFLSSYRYEMSESLWMSELKNQEILFNPKFNFNEFMVDPTKVRDWNIQGLPSDNFSTQNGVIATYSSRFPLMIDPQDQAFQWIVSMEKSNNLKIIDLEQSNYTKVIEIAIQHGFPVLCNNVGETLDPALNPILNKAIHNQNGINVIKFNDKFIDYHQNFKFYITTKLSNPHYHPEISSNTSIINFAVKEQGLQYQLLGIVVRKEKPELEEQKDSLVLSIASKKKKFKNLESEILKLLNDATGSLLDDENLINTLQTSKETSQEISDQLKIAEKTEKNIDIARQAYAPCAERGSILFFVLNDMGKIDPMYQFSLDSYIALFIDSILASPKTTKLEERILNLNNYHTYAVYKFVCRGLFKRHKIMFSFHMCIKIIEAAGKLNKDEYNFFLRGGIVVNRENQMDNPCSNWLPDSSWDNISELDKLPNFHGIISSFEQYARDWHIWFTSSSPETTPLPGEWDNGCNELQKILIVRSLRSDRVAFCVNMFIVNSLGLRFTNPPILPMQQIIEESNCHTPIIFILATGVDPTSTLLNLADSVNMTNKFQALSLGQGQAPIAKRMILESLREGVWLFLANCHLSLDWMPQLYKIIENIEHQNPHKDFRLWLSSKPIDKFPISILQSSIKITTEPPKGIATNMQRLYSFLNEDQFERCQKIGTYKKLLYSLCFFHSVIIERKKFMMLGWNIPYEFNDSDFEVSENILCIYLEEYDSPPWEALKFLIAGISYGGHITDEFDRRLLMTYINDMFNDEVINVPQRKLTSLPSYYIPKDGPMSSYIDLIKQLPAVDVPELFGQHVNAEVTSQIEETKNLFLTLLSLHPQDYSNSVENIEKNVLGVCNIILNQIPNNIDFDATKKIIGSDTSPLNVVLLQEIERYNCLLDLIRGNLTELIKAINGLIVMSTKMEEIFTCISNATVPSHWKLIYPSMKSLGSWTRDLDNRVKMFNRWAETAHPPNIFWISAFTYPTGFLTCVLQIYVRNKNISIDTLGWEFNVLTVDDSNIIEKPKEGVYLNGFYLQGSAWDKKNSVIIESNPMQLISPMPTIHFKPTEVKRRNQKNIYICPCYYYPNRAGNVYRSSYVVSVDLKTGTETPEYWIKRGTALLLSLD